MKQPNYIIILTDDQGYGDLSCMGSKDFITPNIDSLAESGTRFTNWYSGSPVCSPSRASLLTGRYPGYAGVRSILAGHRKASGITPEAPTIAAALKDVGYQTGLIGKWHLGLAENSRPNQNGFDQFYGFMAGCIDYYSHVFYWGMADNSMNPCHDLWENEKEIHEDGTYFTDLISNKAVEQIREFSEKEEPFFLYIGYNAPHYPMHAPKKYMDRFAHLDWDRQVMAAMISAVDDGVGEIVCELKRCGIYDNTCVFYQSDNGPSRESRNWMDGRLDPYYGGKASMLKGHKFSLFEGGIRVPGILSWPSVIPANQVISEPCAAMDIFPTFIQAAGGKLEKYQIDGCDILPVVTQGKRSPHEYLFWEMDKQTAVLNRDYKLVLNGYLVEGEAVPDRVFLSNLSCDPSEKYNLAAELPDITRFLTEKANHWREELEENWSQKWQSHATNLS